MKKYLVIGNPIEHSLSPELHNYWFKKNNINAKYYKEKIESADLKNIISRIKNNEIDGVNVTVPFKKEIIEYLDKLSPEAEKTRSVNTIYLDENKLIGHNTDVIGFEFAVQDSKFLVTGKKIWILGAGGVVPSIIFALNKMKPSQIILSNRTQVKAENIGKNFKNLKILNWGVIPDFDMVINATSVGLKVDDKLDLDFSKAGKGKFFFDVIYNPTRTNFLKTGAELNGQVENGEKMFLYQAAQAFKIWHKIDPKINKEIKDILRK
tara:strand:+ start:17030 stop:17824 length:795 start_codon:yes stop_codon:yes gene_type:complete